MKKTTAQLLRRSRTRAVAAWAAVVVGLAGAAEPARPKPATPGGEETPATSPVVPPASPLPRTTPPEVFKPAPPDELADADKVFSRLDADKRGFVTLDDTKDLLGFDEIFRDADTAGSGQLTRAQFRKAWAAYRARR